MHTSTIFSSLLATASMASASSYIIKNYCRDSVQLFTSSPAATGVGPFELKSGQAWKKDIVGEGNALAVTKSTNFWDSNTAKLNLGTTVGRDQRLYWTLLVQSSPGTDPLAGQKYNITSTSNNRNDFCGNTRKSDPFVFSCANENVELTFNLCAQY